MSFSASVADLIEQSEFDLVAKADRWPRVPIGAVARIINGYPFKSDRFTDRDEGVPIIRIRDVTMGRSKTNYVGEVPEGFWVDDGDLVVGMDGDFNSRIWAGGRGLLNQRVCKIVPDTGVVDLSFLAAVLPGYLSLINEATHSITVKHLSSKTLAETPVPLPPLTEQRQIVAKLDRLWARARAARDYLARTTKLAARAKQAILANALGGFGDVGTLGDLARDIRYGTARKCEYEGGSTPVLRIPNVAAGRIDSTDLKRASFEPRELRTLALESGDLLIIRSNGSIDLVGRSAVVGVEHAGYLYAGYLIRVRLDLDRALPEFVQLVLSSSTTRRSVEGLAKSTSGVNNINSKQLASLPIPHATVPEQRELVRAVGTAFTRIDRLTADAVRAAHLLDRLDERLLAKAFRGELVPQDPTNEPAEALLARICTERTDVPRARRGRRAGEVVS